MKRTFDKRVDFLLNPNSVRSRNTNSTWFIPITSKLLDLIQKVSHLHPLCLRLLLALIPILTIPFLLKCTTVFSKSFRIHHISFANPPLSTCRIERNSILTYNTLALRFKFKCKFMLVTNSLLTSNNLKTSFIKVTRILLYLFNLSLPPGLSNNIPCITPVQM